MRYFAKCKVPASSLTILGKHRLRYLGARYKRRFFKDLLFLFGFQNLVNKKTLKKIWWNENIVSPLQCISDVVHSKSKKQ